MNPHPRPNILASTSTSSPTSTPASTPTPTHPASAASSLHPPQGHPGHLGHADVSAALQGASLAFLNKPKPKLAPLSTAAPSTGGVPSAVASRDNDALAAATVSASASRARSRSPAPRGRRMPHPHGSVPSLGTVAAGIGAGDGPEWSGIGIGIGIESLVGNGYGRADALGLGAAGGLSSTNPALVAAEGVFSSSALGRHPSMAPPDPKSSSVIAATLAASRSSSPAPSPMPSASGYGGRIPRRGSVESTVSIMTAASADGLDMRSIPPTMSMVTLFEEKEALSGGGRDGRAPESRGRTRSPREATPRDSTATLMTPTLRYYDPAVGRDVSPHNATIGGSGSDVLSPSPRRPTSRSRIQVLPEAGPESSYRSRIQVLSRAGPDSTSPTRGRPPLRSRPSPEGPAGSEAAATVSAVASEAATVAAATAAAAAAAAGAASAASSLPKTRPSTPPKPSRLSQGLPQARPQFTEPFRTGPASPGPLLLLPPPRPLRRSSTVALNPASTGGDEEAPPPPTEPDSLQPLTAMTTTSSDDTFVSASSVPSPQSPRSQPISSFKSSSRLAHLSVPPPSPLPPTPTVTTRPVATTAAASVAATTAATTAATMAASQPGSRPSSALAGPPAPPPPRRGNNNHHYGGGSSNGGSLARPSSMSSLPLHHLTSAIMASSLASSRLTPTNTGTVGHFSDPPVSPHPSLPPQTPARVKSPTRMRETMRRPTESQSDDEAAKLLRRRGRSRNPLRAGRHKHKHHEGARKRWRDQITDRERRRYEALWASNRGLLLGGGDDQGEADAADSVVNVVVRDIWKRSRLPDDELAEVWDLVDAEGRGMLGRREFVVGLWLVDQRLKGRRIPARVSESVWYSAGGPLGVQVMVRQPKRRH